MEITKPSANQSPQAVQYTPSDSSIEKNVLAFVRPSSTNFPFVATRTMRNLNFQSSRPAGPRTASDFHTPLAGVGPAVARAASLVRLRASTRAAIFEN